MLEQQRIEYLQAMGIQLWIPRKALDHAAESSWLAENAEAQSASEIANGSSFQAGHAADLLADMGASEPQSKVQSAANLSVEAISSRSPKNTEQEILNRAPDSINQAQATGPDVTEVAVVDFTVPNFELFFALWPCGILWVSNKPFEQADHAFQSAVSYFLLGNGVPQASYSQFKWPYIEGSSEDQSMAVALRALTAQWEFMSGQGARGWVSMDNSSLEWLTKVTAKPLFSVSNPNHLYCSAGKKQLWKTLQNLSLISVS